MVRRLLELTDLRDARCLDIGTQEALIPVSLLRLGAKSVVAYDRLDLSERIRLVQQAYGVEFEYIPGLQMDELQTALWKDRKSPLDVVVFSGVLYHMIDPLVGLCIARSLVREGGLFIVETAALVGDEPILHFNAAGRHYPGSNYYLPTLAWLDYVLRMLRLRAIACKHISKDRPNSRCRVAIVCRAVRDTLAFGDDHWMNQPWVGSDLERLSLDFVRLASNKPEVPFSAEEEFSMHQETGSVDIYGSVIRGSGRHTPNATKGYLMLSDYCPSDTIPG